MPKLCNADLCTRPIFSKGYCAYHQYMRQDKKPPKPKSQKPIPAATKKKYAENILYLAKRKSFLLSNPLCAANLAECRKIATDIHHMQGRGINLLAIETWLPVCRPCHDWIEMHPKEAKELNFSQSRL